VLDLARDAAVELRSVERFNGGDAAAALGGIADGGQETDSGDYDSTGNNVLLSAAK